MVIRNWRDVTPFVGHESAIIWSIFREKGNPEKSEDEAPLLGVRRFTLHMMEGGKSGDYHERADVEQIYYFIRGRGKMKTDDEIYDVKEGDNTHDGIGSAKLIPFLKPRAIQRPVIGLGHTEETIFPGCGGNILSGYTALCMHAGRIRYTDGPLPKILYRAQERRLSILRRTQRMLFVPGFGAIELTSIVPGFTQMPEGVPGEHHQIAASSHNILKLFRNGPKCVPVS